MAAPVLPKTCKQSLELMLLFIKVNYCIMVVKMPFFKNKQFSIVELERLYILLTEEGCLDPSTLFDDFVYFFSGKGKQPINKMKWKKTKTLLAIYMVELTDSNKRPEWVIAGEVFEGVTASSLCDLASKPYSKNAKGSFDSYFSNKLKINKLVSSIRNSSNHK